MKGIPMYLIAALMVLAGSASADQAQVLNGNELDRSRIKIGMYAAVSYRSSKHRQKSAKGYISAMDDHSFTVGEWLWKEKIAYQDVIRLTVGRNFQEVEASLQAPASAPDARIRAPTSGWMKGRKTRWVLPATVGYTGGGFAVGVASILSAPLGSSTLFVPLAGTLIGGVCGFFIGHRADRALLQGRTLSGVHRNAVRAGTVLSGVTVGAFISFLKINPEGNDGEGRDEVVFRNCILGGAAVGTLIQACFDSRLSPASSGHAGIGVTRSGGLLATYRYCF